MPRSIAIWDQLKKNVEKALIEREGQAVTVAFDMVEPLVKRIVGVDIFRKINIKIIEDKIFIFPKEEFRDELLSMEFGTLDDRPNPVFRRLRKRLDTFFR